MKLKPKAVSLSAKEADARLAGVSPDSIPGRWRVPAGDFSEAALEAVARGLLRAAGCDALPHLLKIRWNRRLRTTAGVANYQQGLIALNPKIILFGMEEVDRTLRHELAHLLARFRVGRRRIQPHGPEWRQACLDLGLAGEKRCHDLPLPRRSVARRHRYRCRHCQTEIARVRPLRRRVACLKCCRAFNHGKFDAKYQFVKVVVA